MMGITAGLWFAFVVSASFALLLVAMAMATRLRDDYPDWVAPVFVLGGALNALAAIYVLAAALQ